MIRIVIDNNIKDIFRMLHYYLFTYNVFVIGHVIIIIMLDAFMVNS